VRIIKKKNGFIVGEGVLLNEGIVPFVDCC